ncbi:Conserved protein containing a Zn-ribbon-like motif, possibly RNA-binding [Mycolicibacterium rutilum]|uniref:Conserved protein containing a Zn-ribbon-like motif, possibly RNA-binding n=1 Tax=Mycolicibacterium rutilum TaxID=370526 RepID=A0A1H6LGJ3_MYCRU|nr:CGNR zinc finger domain-containing protein [Mycolicibacterium rutilum]SEH87655.1 Conserved protein containing a Zn-ribbon-like motif, possibly RNA-binding [Mycolicibacterium rutilum]
MVTTADLIVRPRGPWRDAHFIGGHPVLDLANTVVDRSNPAPDNELLKTPADALTWCQAVGLLGRPPKKTTAASRTLLADLREVREQVWAVFTAMSNVEPLPPKQFGALLERAGTGAVTGVVVAGGNLDVECSAPAKIPAALALLAVHAAFTLPPDRIRTCHRCGWLFLDSSRGGRRRWCSMSTCGNREKASRHRSVVN